MPCERTHACTSSLLKKSQASTRQGKNGRKSAVYTLVHEHFEAILHAVSCRLGLFQQAARNRPDSAGRR